MSNINRNRPTYLGNKTDPQLAKVKIMLRWEGYGQEEYTVNELLAQGHLTFEDIQAIADLEGKSWEIPEYRKDNYFDAKWAFLTEMEGVVGEEEESYNEDSEEYTQDSYWELRSEAFARGGMQAVNDLHCSSEIDAEWR
jgi:hypothetical protein